MNQSVELFLTPDEAANDAEIKASLAKKSGIPVSEITAFAITSRSIDARQLNVRVRLVVNIYTSGSLPVTEKIFRDYKNVSAAPPVIIAGTGPAGLFAALKLLELGFKPVLIERGKNVRERRKDLAALNRGKEVNPDSNYCFGEGGAGTYSDGKLYTRSKKRGNVKSVLETLVMHGANPGILVDAHPHIGTNKLPPLIQQLRETILNHGGEFYFETRIIDFVIKDGKFFGIEVRPSGQNGKSGIISAPAIILATGHSARDIFEVLPTSGIRLEPKPFALGLRIEHPQETIDRVQYHCETRHPLLPPAPYSLATQVGERGVFSFCMCPGGFIVPAATAPGEIVVNGMSPSRRDSRFANSGIVVSVEPQDLVNPNHPFSFLSFQKKTEQLAFQHGGGNQKAPAQRLTDFLDGKNSATLPETSYQPGLTSADLSEVLPGQISQRLKDGFLEFGKKMKGFLTQEAILVGVESRTSSPIRIPRNSITLMHPDAVGFFPCGEGAGYAGGIVSAAMDGERCALAVKSFLR